MAVTLVVIRHAKSDWSVPAADRDRPLAGRGRKQAPATGRWIETNCPAIDLAVVSVAARTRQTWTLIAAELGDDVDVRESEDAYTFDGQDLVELIRHLPTSANAVALVSHNPAVEELVEALSEEWVPMPTSALAVLELDDWTSAGAGSARLIAAGRPADDQWHVTA